MSDIPPITISKPLTRAQMRLSAKLQAGYVAVMRKMNHMPSRYFMLRSPRSHETDGPIVTAKTVEALERAGLAVRAIMPGGITWVFSRWIYERSEAGKIAARKAP